MNQDRVLTLGDGEIMRESVHHIPVMLQEVKTLLNLKPNALVVDGTVGLGGHAREILKGIGPGGRLIGIDRDKESLNIAQENLKEFSSQCELIQEDFRHLDKILEGRHIDEVDGILLDLGISSFQLENPQRGFSFQEEGPLDMRMDQESYISAYDLINSLSEHEIASILKEFGEEHWHNRIAHYVVEQRAQAPISSTQELRDVVFRAIPVRFREHRIHPATRTFQAIRIAVNRELEALEAVLDQAFSILKRGGRLAVISFHSLEDRIVKHKFRQWAGERTVEVLTKKPLRPTAEEMQNNPRSRSARLRVMERRE